MFRSFFPNGRWLRHQDPFPDPDEDDGEEPDGFLPPDAETGPEQGLFLCLPAGEFDPDQFAQSGPSPDVAPGGMTATLMDMVSGPNGSGVAGLSDNQLVGIIAAAKRHRSWSAWVEMTGTREFARRAQARGPQGQFAADELADELHLTYNAAAGRMDYATTEAGSGSGQAAQGSRPPCRGGPPVP